MDSLASHPLILSLPPESRREAEAAFLSGDVGPDELLMEEGETDASMTIILGGEVSVSVGEPPMEAARLGPGEMVGEMAMLTSVKRRSATVRTLTDCRLAVLEESAWRHLRLRGHPICTAIEVGAVRSVARRVRATDERIASLVDGQVREPVQEPGLLGRLAGVLTGTRRRPGGRRPDPAEVMARSPAFRNVPEASIQELADHVTLVPLAAGERITEVGTPADEAWLVASGWVDVYCATRSGAFERVAVLSDGAMFGLVALVDGGLRTATCVTASPTWLVRFHRDDFLRLFESGGAAARGLRAAFLESLSSQLRLANTQVEAALQARRLAGLEGRPTTP